MTEPPTSGLLPELTGVIRGVVDHQRRELREFDAASAKKAIVARVARDRNRSRFHAGLLAAAVFVAVLFVVHAFVPTEGGGAPEETVPIADGARARAAVSVTAAADTTSPPPTPVRKPVEPRPSPTGRAPAQPAPPTVPAPVPVPKSWMQHLADGDTEAAMDRVDEQGVGAATRGASARELLRLAEVAMIAKRSTLARSALHALETSHAGTEQAAIASFYLGRLDMKKGAHASAASAFRSYLDNHPKGPLAREAHGRLIEAHMQAGDKAKARQVARDYLARYPKGPHVATARRALRN